MKPLDPSPTEIESSNVCHDIMMMINWMLLGDSLESDPEPWQ